MKNYDQIIAEYRLTVQKLELQNAKYLEALNLIAAPPRPDGTYNRCREACQKLAKEVIKS